MWYEVVCVLQADGEKKKMRVNISLEQLIIPGAYPAPLLPSMHFRGSISDISSPSEPPSRSVYVEKPLGHPFICRG
ncbi:hypothetical protein EYF80_024880 [Liparis tanakae]|uniref:Uncharacterized protein n=1 Tax=Liparis tanakae TaxID=230148 RepID=A0A4Z2HJ48_9TELE|nr:hypothetical protein EYF80_024880 [Liparis tanakae]